MLWLEAKSILQVVALNPVMQCHGVWLLIKNLCELVTQTYRKGMELRLYEILYLSVSIYRERDISH